MTMTRSDFKKQLQDGLNARFGMEYKRHPEQWRDIFEIHSSKKAAEEDVLMVGLGGAPVKEEGRGVAYDAGGEGWSARYIHETIALAFAITEEAEEDGLYGKLGAQFSTSLARSFQHTKEVKGANILNNGFSVNGGDGVPLFSVSHPLHIGGVFANTFAVQADLAEASLEAALTGINQFVDDRGIPIVVNAKKLIVPPSLVFDADRILNSNLRSGTSDNDLNSIKNQGLIPGGVRQNHRISDTNSWFITTDIPDGLKHFKRVGLSGGVEGDFETGNMRYKKRERYSFGYTDPRGAWGSSGST
jgi:hypothetical protein